MKVKQGEYLFFLIVSIVLCVCAGCEKYDKYEADAVSNMETKKDDDTIHDKMVYIDVLHSKGKNVEIKKLTDINISEDEEYVQNNNNIINGSFIVPYQDGYFYSVDDSVETHSDGPTSALIYDDGKGNSTKQKEWLGIEYIYDDFIYYYDLESNALKRRKDGQEESIINFQYSEFYNTVFYAENYIYYIDIDDNHSKTYIGKVDYNGSQNEKLYELNVNLEQIYQYGNELWFIYHDFNDADNCFGKVNLVDNSVTVYKGLSIIGVSSAGCQLSFNNGYVYFNSSGFKRLNIQDDSVEQIFDNTVDAVNFIGNNILFCIDKNLYKMDANGVKKIKTLKGKTDGFDGIRVDGNKIYIGTYSGAFYNEIYQIDIKGRTIKDIITK